MALELEAYPKFIHFDEIGKDKGDGVLEVASGAGGVAHGEMISSLSREVVAEE
jgi:hypothetical protein